MHYRLILCLAALLLVGQQCRGQGKKYALIVGVEKYNPAQLTSLQYAEDDADALGQSLQRLGFDVIVMTRQSNIPERVPAFADDILTQLKRRVRNRSTGDTLIVALSGHGVQLKGDKAGPDGTKETYFCPERADLRKRSTLLAMSDVMEVLKQCKAGRKLLLVDACRNEVEPKDIAGKDFSPVEIELDPAGVTRRTIPGGMVALFSCSSKERSFEVSNLNHSVFTYHVLQYLNGKAATNRYPKQQVSISELAAYVSRETRDYIDNRLGKDQNPELVLPDRRLIDWSLGGMPLTTNSIGMKLALIPAGEFLMGSPVNEEGREYGESQHRVRITQSFYIQTTEVTQGQWKSVMGTEPWKTEPWKEVNPPPYRMKMFADPKEGADYAASYMSHDDAVEFCRKLSARDGATYRLPTEAEWEYACRSGTESSYSFGDSGDQLRQYAWFEDKALDIGERYAHRVGQKLPNGFGLYDMHGNVWELCSDWHGEDYYDFSPTSDPTGPSEGSLRVIRGGAWFNAAGGCRSASRLRWWPSIHNYGLGFRVVRSSEK